MHLRIGSLLLLALGVYGAIVKREDGPANLEGINKFRQLIGQSPLEWDESLVAKAKAMPRDCDKLEHGDNYRVFLDLPDENAQKALTFYYLVLFFSATASENPALNQTVKDELKEVITGVESDLERGEGNLFALELLNPAQSKIGCARATCSATVPPNIVQSMADFSPALALNGDKVSTEAICVIGPSRKWPPFSQASMALPESESFDGGKVPISFTMQVSNVPSADFFSKTKKKFSHNAPAVMESSGIISTTSVSILLTSLFYGFFMYNIL